MHIVLLTSQNSNTCLKLVKQVVTLNRECNLDIYFGKIQRTTKSKIQRQVNNIKRNGLLWIPYRLMIGVSKYFRWREKNKNAPTLLDNLSELERVTFKIIPSYDSKELWQEIDHRQYDLGIVFGTGIIKKELFTLPKRGMINIHQGLTQWYRGQPPGFWELYNNERESGITIHKVTEKLDSGDIVFQKCVLISQSETLEKLQKKLDDLVIENIAKVVRNILEDTASATPVDLSKGKTYTRPTLKELRELKRRIRNRRCNIVTN